MVKKRANKSRDLLRLLITLVILVLVNYIGTEVFTRFDLTLEKRFSLSDASKEQVRELEDVVFVRVYLEGELPSNYKQLRNATKEMLDEFRAYSDGNLEYEFINPAVSDDPKKNEDVYRELTRQGLQYTNIKNQTTDHYSEQIIFPGAIIFYQGEEIPLQLLKSQLDASEEVLINNSIQQLEYEISSSIAKLTRTKREKIAIIQGHGELSYLEIGDLWASLEEFYTVDTLTIQGQLNALKEIDGLIIARPVSEIPEKDKFIIDQFVMRGGKVMWVIEHTSVNSDSLWVNATTMGLPQSVNLEDQLFQYGVRVNSDLVMDLQAMQIPVVVGMKGNQPRQQFLAWPFSPQLLHTSNHPIVKSLDPISTEFVNSIDTISRDGIKTTALLNSSPQTKVVRAPTRVSLNILREPLDPRQFKRGNKTVAVLQEGIFESVFKGRVPPQIRNNKEFGFKEKSAPTKMIMISDAEIIKNPVNLESNRYFPLGFDKYTNTVYGNKDFLLNAINYLFDDSGLIEVRAKEFKIRLLDESKLRDRTRWQVLNTVFPIVLVLLFGLLQFYYRKNRFGGATRVKMDKAK